MKTLYVKIQPESAAVSLRQQFGGDKKTIIAFFRDIYRGYATVKEDKKHNSFIVEEHKEIPDSLLWERVDQHPFLISNPNRKIEL